ncbi:MAG: hypothetical protein GXO33_05820 [Epsilonproteobacteria bacterium]|jgi:hypothetical protein|nr:hypothetical protein [Campylobacterota bacterium]
MYKIDIEKRCSCVKKDKELSLPLSFDNEAEAELKALKLANHMNANYCKKHRFYVTKEGETFTIRVELACPAEI